MNALDQLEAQLRSTGKFWQYATRTQHKNLSDSERLEIAQTIFAASKQWAQGFAEEFAARHYPPGFDQ